MVRVGGENEFGGLNYKKSQMLLKRPGLWTSGFHVHHLTFFLELLATLESPFLTDVLLNTPFRLVELHETLYPFPHQVSFGITPSTQPYHMTKKYIQAHGNHWQPFLFLLKIDSIFPVLCLFVLFFACLFIFSLTFFFWSFLEDT